MVLAGFPPCRNMPILKHVSMISCFEGAAAAYLFQKRHFVFQDNFHHHFKIEGSLDKNCYDFFCLFVCSFSWI